MNSVPLLNSSLSLIFQLSQRSAAAYREFCDKFPALQRSLTCTVCKKLLIDPYTPMDTTCQHHVCKNCLGSKKTIKPSCSWCSDPDRYVRNVTLQEIIKCYCKLCNYILTTRLHIEIASNPGNNNSEVYNELLELFQVGSRYTEELGNNTSDETTADEEIKTENTKQKEALTKENKGIEDNNQLVVKNTSKLNSKYKNGRREYKKIEKCGGIMKGLAGIRVSLERVANLTNGISDNHIEDKSLRRKTSKMKVGIVGQSNERKIRKRTDYNSTMNGSTVGYVEEQEHERATNRGTLDGMSKEKATTKIKKRHSSLSETMVSKITPIIQNKENTLNETKQMITRTQSIQLIKTNEPNVVEPKRSLRKRSSTSQKIDMSDSQRKQRTKSEINNLTRVTRSMDENSRPTTIGMIPISEIKVENEEQFVTWNERMLDNDEPLCKRTRSCRRAARNRSNNDDFGYVFEGFNIDLVKVEEDDYREKVKVLELVGGFESVFPDATIKTEVGEEDTISLRGRSINRNSSSYTPRDRNIPQNSSGISLNGTGMQDEEQHGRHLSKGCNCGRKLMHSTVFPCNGQRCPCYINNRSCTSCRCWGCRNPYSREIGSNNMQSNGFMKI